MKKHTLYQDETFNKEIFVDINVSVKAEKLLVRVHAYHKKYLEAQEELLQELDRHNSGREWDINGETLNYDLHISQWDAFDVWIGSNIF